MTSIICSTFFAVIGQFLIIFPAAGVDEPTGSPPPLPVGAGEHLTADLVNLIFLFDRAVSKPPGATTQNYLEQIFRAVLATLSGLPRISATQDR